MVSLCFIVPLHQLFHAQVMHFGTLVPSVKLRSPNNSQALVSHFSTMAHLGKSPPRRYKKQLDNQPTAVLGTTNCQKHLTSLRNN